MFFPKYSIKTTTALISYSTSRILSASTSLTVLYCCCCSVTNSSAITNPASANSDTAVPWVCPSSKGRGCVAVHIPVTPPDRVVTVDAAVSILCVRWKQAVLATSGEWTEEGCQLENFTWNRNRSAGGDGNGSQGILSGGMVVSCLCNMPGLFKVLFNTLYSFPVPMLLVEYE